MAQRTRRTGSIQNVPELLKALADMRDRLTRTSIDVRPYGTAYHAVHMVIRAIDALATFVTGQRAYFSVGFKPSTFDD